MKKIRVTIVAFAIVLCAGGARAQVGGAAPSGMPEGAKVLMEGLKFAEGPLIDRKGVLYFSAVMDSKIYRWDGKKGEVFYQGSEGNNGLAMHKDGTIYSAAGRGKAILKIAPDGKGTKYLTEVEGKALNSPNDLVFDAKGNLFFTNPGGMTATSGIEPSVVRVRPDGTAKIVAADLDYPNGIKISPDGQWLYVNDLLGGSLVKRYPLSGDGEVGKGEVLIKFGGGYPDGLAVAASGNLYVALNLHAKIVKVSPEGKILKEIQFPKGSGVSNLCFAGDDMRTLYVTLGSGGKLVEMRADEPGLKLFSHR